MPADLAATLGGTTGKGNRIHEYKDYGFELGGPILKNRLWAWGAIGKTHVDLLTLTGAHDRTELQDTSFKATGQITNGIRANFTFFRGNKEKFGRGAARPVRRKRPTTRPARPRCTRARATSSSAAICSSSAKGAHVDGGFSLAPRGGPDVQYVHRRRRRAARTADTSITDRPRRVRDWMATPSRGHHELKFGFGWRKASVGLERHVPRQRELDNATSGTPTC